jgi:hypothetical protein
MLYLLSLLRLMPHCVCLYFSKHKNLIRSDIQSYDNYQHMPAAGEYGKFLYLMSNFPEFRSVFYFRLFGWHQLWEYPWHYYLLTLLCKPHQSCTIRIMRGGAGRHEFCDIAGVFLNNSC